MKVLPLYLPFQGCAHQCVYCNQPLIVGREDERALWPERLRSLDASSTGSETEIGFYGGTFSALPRETMLECFNRAAPYARRAGAAFRISTRPDRVDDDTLVFLRDRGVATIELGVESFDDAVLLKSGRGHDARSARAACRRVKEHGFQLGIHLMTGLPKQDTASWRGTVAETLAIRPELVRIAPTLVLKQTPLEALYRRGAYQPQLLEDAVEQCAFAYARFHRAGIRIARVGLALSDADGCGEDKLVAGPWHPSLRHEVESRLAFECIESALEQSIDRTIHVNPKDISIAQGSKRRNLLRLRERFGDAIALIQDDCVTRHRFRIGHGHEQPLFWGEP